MIYYIWETENYYPSGGDNDCTLITEDWIEVVRAVLSSPWKHDNLWVSCIVSEEEDKFWKKATGVHEYQRRFHYIGERFLADDGEDMCRTVFGNKYHKAICTSGSWEPFRRQYPDLLRPLYSSLTMYMPGTIEYYKAIHSTLVGYPDFEDS